MVEKKETKCVAFCPHCGNRAPQRLVYSRRFLSGSYDMQGNLTEGDLPAIYYVSECETCQEILIYLAEGLFPEEEQFSEATLMWPDPASLGDGVPESVKEIYREAAIIKNAAPNAFAVQIRRALEALCDDKGTAKGSLYERLKGLVDNNQIPPVLAEMSDILRLLGNMGAHASEQSVKPGHVRVIDEFFRAIIEYVYIAPKKVNELKKRLKLLKHIEN